MAAGAFYIWPCRETSLLVRFLCRPCLPKKKLAASGFLLLVQGHLAGVSQSEWEAIPDVGDYSLKYKQSKRREIFTPMPDHVIEGARNDTAVSFVFFSSPNVEFLYVRRQHAASQKRIPTRKERERERLALLTPSSKQQLGTPY